MSSLNFRAVQKSLQNLINTNYVQEDEQPEPRESETVAAEYLLNCLEKFEIDRGLTEEKSTCDGIFLNKPREA